MDRPLRALMLGGIAWNTMVYLDTFPEPRPHTVFAKGSYTTVGSSGAGKALNMRHLGAETTLWGLLGDDEPGEAVREFMCNRGVTLLTDVDPKGTMRHINLMDDSGDRISIFANAGSHEFEVDIDRIRPIARDADIVSVTIMNYCRAFLPMLQGLGKPISVDIHDWDGVNPHHDEFITAADYLFMSSLAMPDWRSFLETRIAAGATAAICTHGAAGASGITAGKGWVDVPAVPVESVVDTNGAGDACYAGFMSSWLTGEGLEDSLRRGAATASAVVQSPDLAPT
ncbi:MAG: carbohydrate kinase family protein [bacterium]|nr:carbohydrate kinase family protein [bacterium]